MASGKEYLDYVLEQLSDLDGITYRAMMGVSFITGEKSSAGFMTTASL